MEASGFQSLLEAAGDNLGWLALAAFGFAFLESLAVVGVFIPGIVLLFVVSALLGWDPAGFVVLWAAATAGAIAGDGVSFWIGRRFGSRLERAWPFSRYPEWLSGARAQFDLHGGKSVFVGRFIGPLRPIVPMVAGMLGMRAAPFVGLMVSACILWAPLYLVPGMLFGASLDLAAELGGRLAVLLVVVVLGTWLVLWITRGVYAFSARRAAWWLKGMVVWTRRHPLLSRLIGPLFEPGRREVLSIGFLGLLLLMCLAVLMAVLMLAPLATPPWDAERQAATLAASLRSHFADPVFALLSVAGDLRVMGLLAGVVLLVLAALNRIRAAGHWLMAVMGAWLIAEALNGFMGILLDRPEVLLTLGEVPHVGYTVTTAVFEFFAVMLAKDLAPRRRKWPYLITTLVLLSIGFAHFYLGRATLIGLAAALAAGGGWVCLTGIGYRLRAQPRPAPLGLAVAFYGVFVLLVAGHAGMEYRTVLETSRLAQPYRLLEREAWLRTAWSVLPQQRSRVGRGQAQAFELQLAGDLGLIRGRLDATGWSPPPSLDAENLPLLFTARPDPERKPHFSRDFAGRPENLVRWLVRPDGRVVLLRVWSSGARLQPGGEPVWLAQLRVMESRRMAIGVNRWAEVPAERDQALDMLRVIGWDWHWTRPDPDGPWLALLEPEDLPGSARLTDRR